MKSLIANWIVLGSLVLASCSYQYEKPSTNESTTGNLASPTTQRGDIPFFTDSAQAQQLAHQQGRPCLLFFTDEKSKFCQQMETTLFTNSSIKQLAQNFACILIDADENANVCQQHKITGYPTLQFQAADGRPLHSLTGCQPASKLAASMHAALERVAWLDSANFKQR